MGSLKLGFFVIAALVNAFHYIDYCKLYSIFYLLPVLLLILGILYDEKEFGVLVVQSFIEGLIIDFLQDCLQGSKGFL